MICRAKRRARTLEALVRKRLAVDFGVAPSPVQTKAAFFASPEFRQKAITWLVERILQRGATIHDHALCEPANAPAPDLLTIAISILSGDEFFIEQSGDNARLFLFRVAGFLPSAHAIPGNDAPLLSSQAGRAELLHRTLAFPKVRHEIVCAIYNTAGLRLPAAGKLAALALVDQGFAEGVLSSATSELRYLVDAAKGMVSRDICEARLVRTLMKLIPNASVRLQAELHTLASDHVRGGALATSLDRISSLFFEHADAKQRSLAVAGRFLPDESLSLRAIVLMSEAGTNASSLEKHYRAPAEVEAGRIVAFWLDTYSGVEFLDREQVHIHWRDRLLENDDIADVLFRFLFSDACLGACSAALRKTSAISTPPGCNLGMRPRGPDLEKIVAASYFYWYDAIDGQALLACPDTMSNDPGVDSLSVAPLRRDDFSYQSLDWHRSELLDMIRASVNVVLPVSYVHPFSCDRPDWCRGDTHQRLRFANAGLRTLRAAWLDLEREGRPVPHVGLFYDTSTLNRDNRFALKVDFRRRYAKTWFYESIRDFFSYFPQRMWARFDGLPIVFVYHPCFGDFLDDGLYAFVRRCFREDFGTDLYIVTAAEEEAPRVLQAPQLVRDAEALSDNNGIDVLADILCKEELYASVLWNDDAFSAMILGRTLGPVLSLDEAKRRFPSAGLADADRRKAFITDVVWSPDFRRAVMRVWFSRLLRTELDMRDPSHVALVDEAATELARGDWMAALCTIVASDAFYAAAGGEPGYFADWLYQSVVLKHPNDLCTPQYGSIHADGEGKRAFLAALMRHARRDAVRTFLQRYEVREAIVSLWYYQYYGWYNPGEANSSFYWSAAISPTIRGVASIGPGYDQRKLRHRPTLCMPRRDGKTYEDVWKWVVAMRPRPRIVHIESWNEFFEGTAVCASQEYGYQYIDLTKQFAGEFLGSAASDAVEEAAAMTQPAD